MSNRLYSETVILHIPGGPTGEWDDLGNPIIGPAVDLPWPAWYEVGNSTEETDAREQQVWGYTLYLQPRAYVGEADEPMECPLTYDSEVTIDGTRYRVEGEPGRQPDGFIVEGYVRAAVTRVEG